MQIFATDAGPRGRLKKLASMVAEPEGSSVIRTDDQYDVASLEIDISRLSLDGS